MPVIILTMRDDIRPAVLSAVCITVGIYVHVFWSRRRKLINQILGQAFEVLPFKILPNYWSTPPSAVIFQLSDVDGQRAQ